MKISLSNYKYACLALGMMGLSFKTLAQDSSKFFQRIKSDTSTQKMSMDAIYNRPFLTMNKLPLAIGGYAEANTEFISTDGVNEGFNFQMRRMTLFFSSTVAKRIKFLSEIEFENGTSEINIETALVDMELHPLLNLRGGILLNPIGSFNQNHDGPRWDFIDRPLSATEIIPSTLSNVGFGFHGKYFFHNWTFGYETYLTNGFDGKLISNEMNRTSFHEAKEGADKFSTSFSGSPMFTGKLAVRNRKIGEIGLSYLSGIYNQWQRDGLQIDEKRNAHMMALDFNTSILKRKVAVCGEIVKANIELPAKYVQDYGSKQLGFYCDIVATVLQRKMLGWENASLNVGVRTDYADFNRDTFREGDYGKIFDETWAITPSIAFRPVGTTVVRFNYKHQQTRDLVGNPASKTAIIQFGISSYF